MPRLRIGTGGELARLLGAGFTGFAGTAEVEGVSSRAWASITFSGERHTLTLRLQGEDAPAAADRFLAELAEREFDLRGHIVADIAALADERDESGTLVVLRLEALTVEAG